MSTIPDDGGPIAPDMVPGPDGILTAIDGLSKREYFAAMALQGILSGTTADTIGEVLFETKGRTDWKQYQYSELVALHACDVADALLAALSATPEPQSPPAPPYEPASPMWQIIEEMSARGGTFVTRLASTMRAADTKNMAAIVGAFPDIIRRYDAMALLAAGQSSNADVYAPRIKESQ